MLATLTIAFTAGLVSTVNPCGFAMLPAYLSYFMGLDHRETGRPAVVGRGLAIGTVVSAGFLVVFGIAGALLVLGLQTVRDVIPWAALAIGAGLLVLGIAMMRGYYLNIRVPTIRARTKEQTWFSIFIFGVSYAIASLSCTLPVFLSVVVGTFTQQNFIGGFAAFVAYTAGMAVVLIGITVALALGRDSLVSRLRSSGRYMNKISGAILVIAGGFVVVYWAIILAFGAENLNNFPAARLVEQISSAATRFIGDYPLAIAIVLGGGIAAAAWYARVRKPTPADGAEPTDDLESVDSTS